MKRFLFPTLAFLTAVTTFLTVIPSAQALPFLNDIFRELDGTAEQEREQERLQRQQQGLVEQVQIGFSCDLGSGIITVARDGSDLDVGFDVDVDNTIIVDVVNNVATLKCGDVIIFIYDATQQTNGNGLLIRYDAEGKEVINEDIPAIHPARPTVY